MRDLVIERAEVFVVGPETERYAWAEGMSEQFMANTVLRLTTRGGLEGVAGAAMCSSHGFDRSVAETLRYLLPEVIGPLAAGARGAVVPAAHAEHAAGAAGTVAGRHRACGISPPRRQTCRSGRCWAARASQVPAYASTPLLADAAAYVDYVAERAAEGFRAVKFHCWCEPSRDLPMVEAVRAAHRPGAAWR